MRSPRWGFHNGLVTVQEETWDSMLSLSLCYVMRQWEHSHLPLEPGHADTLTLGRKSPVWENTLLLFKPPSLWDFCYGSLSCLKQIRCLTCSGQSLRYYMTLKKLMCIIKFSYRIRDAVGLLGSPRKRAGLGQGVIGQVLSPWCTGLPRVRASYRSVQWPSQAMATSMA